MPTSPWRTSEGLFSVNELKSCETVESKAPPLNPCSGPGVVTAQSTQGTGLGESPVSSAHSNALPVRSICPHAPTPSGTEPTGAMFATPWQSLPDTLGG